MRIASQGAQKNAVLSDYAEQRKKVQAEIAGYNHAMQEQEEQILAYQRNIKSRAGITYRAVKLSQRSFQVRIIKKI